MFLEDDDLDALCAPLQPGEPGYDEDDDHFELSGLAVHLVERFDVAVA